MRLLLHWRPLILIVAIAFSGCAAAPSDPSTVSHVAVERPVTSAFANELVTRLDSLARAAAESEPVAGFSVAILKGRDTLLLAGYGHADIGLDVPATESTKYRLVGPSTTMQAALVMRQVEKGLVGLDDDVTPHLPDFPWQDRRVTVRQLLDATSGLPDYHYLGDAYWSEIAVPKSPDQVTALFAGRPFAHEPGERQQWTISGFHLAGLLLERLTGKPYGQLIAEEIAAPLGLEHTVYCGDRQVVPGLATGYETAGNDVLPAGPGSPSMHPFVVSVCASASDVAEFYRALRTGRLITRESYDDMTTLTPPGRAAMEESGSALVAGLVRDTLAGGTTLMFGGLELGYASHAMDIPEHDLTVVVLTNALWAPGWRLAFDLTRAALGWPIPAEEPGEPRAELLDLPVSPRASTGTRERTRSAWRSRALRIVSTSERTAYTGRTGNSGCSRSEHFRSGCCDRGSMPSHGGHRPRTESSFRSKTDMRRPSRSRHPVGGLSRGGGVVTPLPRSSVTSSGPVRLTRAVGRRIPKPASPTPSSPSLTTSLMPGRGWIRTTTSAGSVTTSSSISRDRLFRGQSSRRWSGIAWHRSSHPRSRCWTPGWRSLARMPPSSPSA
jgi:D-alanyl-D-alanine carboxypeptidase